MRWSGVRADHVGLVDAATLWFSAADLPAGSRLALRSAGGTIDLGVVATAEGLAAALDLTPYADQAGGSDGLELVVVTAGERAVPVRPALMAEADERPTVAPPVPGTTRAWRLDLRPSVRLRLVEVTTGVQVRSVAAVDDELVVLLDLPHEAEPLGRTVAPDGSGVRLPTELTEAGWVVRLDDRHVGGLEVPHVVRVSWAGEELPVVRAWHDLGDPGRAVPLPMLAGQGERFVQVAWNAAGVLTARISARAEGLA